MENGEYVTRGSGNSSVRFLRIRRVKQACIRNYNFSLYPAKTPLENSWRQLSFVWQTPLLPPAVLCRLSITNYKLSSTLSQSLQCQTRA